jgi:spoIIIJ-associated protein
MSEWKTFSGKSVDEAMEEACRSLGAPREKLEIELLSGGSSGIFGLVGKKKAQVRARLREEINLLGDMAAKERRENGRRNQRQSEAPRSEPAPKAASRAEAAPKPASRPEPAPRAEAAASGRRSDTPAPVSPDAPAAAAAAPETPAPVETVAPAAAENAAPAPQRTPRPAPAPKSAPSRPAPTAQAEPAVFDEGYEDDFDEASEADNGRAPRESRRTGPQAEPQPLTPELSAIVREVMEHMLDGILGQRPEFEISGHSERVSVLIFDEENSGLLIGREGQTLAAIQYIVNRIVIRRHGNPVKVQINTGEYRERQDDNLRKMAIFLADKAKTLGRPQSTKPLSSYHRRVVHLALQEDEGISTRSKGEGPLKRVLIVPRGGRGESASSQRSQG